MMSGITPHTAEKKENAEGLTNSLTKNEKYNRSVPTTLRFGSRSKSLKGNWLSSHIRCRKLEALRKRMLHAPALDAF